MDNEQEALAELERQVEAWAAADPYEASLFVEEMTRMLDEQDRRTRRAKLRVVSSK